MTLQLFHDIIIQLNREELELQSLVEYFYAIDGVPAKGVKLRDLHHMKVFIQNTSQGSRCLRKGEKLLYLKEVNLMCLFACYIASINLKLPNLNKKTGSGLARL